jgi:calpain-7
MCTKQNLYFYFSYTLVISQYEKSSTIYYSLRAYARAGFELKQIDKLPTIKEVPRYRSIPILTLTHLNNSESLQLSGEWKGHLAGGCPNYPDTYKNNPLYRVTVGPKENSNLVIELRGPKVSD